MDFQTHLHLGAWHDSAQYGTTSNPGIGVLVRESDFIAGAGVWRNSLDETTPYMFAGYQPATLLSGKLGWAAGITKYRGKVVPLAGVLLTWKVKGVEYHLFTTPAVKKVAPMAVELSVSF